MSQRIVFGNASPRRIASSRSEGPPRAASRDGDAEEALALLQLVHGDAVALGEAAGGFLSQVDGAFTHSSGVLRAGPPRERPDASAPRTRGRARRRAAPSRARAAGERPQPPPTPAASQPISNSSAGIEALDVAAGDVPRERPHAADVGGALGHRERASGVEQVEGVRALQHLVVRGQRQAELQEPPAPARSRRSGA